MKTPTLEEVKAFFKDAKEVRCLFDKEVYDISEWGRFFDNEDGTFWIEESESSSKQAELFAYGEYAEIISYKSKLYQLTSKEIKPAYENPQWLKDTFKDVFETELEDNTYYHFENGALQFNIKDGKGYGLCHYKNWVDECSWVLYSHNGSFRKATKQEVFEALKNDAVKRGFENKYVEIKLDDKTYLLEKEFGKYQLLFNILFYQGAPIFKDGTWAEIIKPKQLTIAEIEKILGYKIEIKDETNL